MKKRTAYVIFVLILLCLCLLLMSCKKSEEELILDRLDAFLIAYNNGDLEGVLECMDSRSRQTFEGLFGLFGSFSGYEFSDLFGVAVGLTSDGDLLNVEVIDIVMESEENATVYTEMSYTDQYTNDTQKVKFLMVKEEGDWFVKDMENYVDHDSNS